MNSFFDKYFFRPTNLGIRDWVFADRLQPLTFEPAALALVKYKQRHS